MMSNSRGLDPGCLKKVVLSLSKYTVVYSLLGRVPTVCFLVDCSGLFCGLETSGHHLYVRCSCYAF